MSDMKSSSTPAKATGGCLCGAVTYEVSGPIRNVIECHCSTCRRFSGGLWHGSAARMSDVTLHDEHGALTWYKSSDEAERGFCSRCGSSLACRRTPPSSTPTGSLDDQSGLEIGVRIFTGNAAAYGDWRSQAPEFEEWPPAHYFDVPE